MRCPACNTENTPDSRFCGGCGAKLVLTEPRVAPTAKIPDDAPFPTPGALTTTTPGVHAARPISYAPPSLPPRATEPSAPQPIARVPDASLSIPVPRRRTGMIATVLVIDLALAGSGAVLLAKGLDTPSKPSVPAPAPTSMPSHPSVTPAPSVTPVPASASPAPGSGVAAVGSGSADDAIASALARAGSAGVGGVGTLDLPPHPPAPAPIHAAAKHGPMPQDPYDTAHALANEVELATDRAGPDFERCLEKSLRETPIHGAIHVSFAVAPDGHVDHARVADNSTGSASLAGCLIATISAWRFATHPTHWTPFVRPFSYP